MGTLETVLLTGAIVVIDVLILNEYLKLEEELRKIKEFAGQTTANLVSIAEQVTEPLPTENYQFVTSNSFDYKSQASEAIITEATGKSDAERENEKLKAEKQVLVDSRTDANNEQLDEIENKIDEITGGVKSAKEKMVQYS
ncbi:MAG: hypothetical protein V1644_03890 [Candidatus Micrarchaeota archaeon]